MSSTKKKTSKGTSLSKKKNVHQCYLGTEKCVFCGSNEDNEATYGQKIVKDGLFVHYFCMLFASGLCQNGKSDSTGILGFLPADIVTEVRRAKRLRCVYCSAGGASIGCLGKNCRKSYHFGCAVRHGVLFQFFDCYQSFCREHRPQQSLKQWTTSPKKHAVESVCSVCMCPVENKPSDNVLKAPCCRDSWFHRECVQRYATSSGLYYFKCPLCNNKDDFQDEMLQFGVYIPDQDAAWERENNAFADLLERHCRCDVQKCLCPKGRNYDKDDSKWEIILCQTCGAHGGHIGCVTLPRNKAFVCPDCTEMTAKIRAMQPKTPAKSSSQAKKSAKKDASQGPSCTAKMKMKVAKKTFHKYTPSKMLQKPTAILSVSVSRLQVDDEMIASDRSPVEASTSSTSNLDISSDLETSTQKLERQRNEKTGRFMKDKEKKYVSNTIDNYFKLEASEGRRMRFALTKKRGPLSKRIHRSTTSALCSSESSSGTTHKSPLEGSSSVTWTQVEKDENIFFKTLTPSPAKSLRALLAAAPSTKQQPEQRGSSKPTTLVLSTPKKVPFTPSKLLRSNSKPNDLVAFPAESHRIKNKDVVPNVAQRSRSVPPPEHQGKSCKPTRSASESSPRPPKQPTLRTRKLPISCEKEKSPDASWVVSDEQLSPQIPLQSHIGMQQFTSSNASHRPVSVVKPLKSLFPEMRMFDSIGYFCGAVVDTTPDFIPLDSLGALDIAKDGTISKMPVFDTVNESCEVPDVMSHSVIGQTSEGQQLCGQGNEAGKKRKHESVDSDEAFTTSTKKLKEWPESSLDFPDSLTTTSRSPQPKHTKKKRRSLRFNTSEYIDLEDFVKLENSGCLTPSASSYSSSSQDSVSTQPSPFDRSPPVLYPFNASPAFIPASGFYSTSQRHVPNLVIADNQVPKIVNLPSPSTREPSVWSKNCNSPRKTEQINHKLKLKKKKMQIDMVGWSIEDLPK